MTLSALAKSLTPPFAFCGIGIARAGHPPEYHISTAPGIDATEHSLFRAASISKIVTAETLRRVGANPRVLDVSIADLLGIPFHHPDFPQIPLTLRMLLSHTSGLNDAAGYLIRPGTDLPDWLMSHGANLFLPHQPGTYFSYSNLGYILIAAAAEVIGQDRFDHLARRLVLDPLGINGGFNWSGVSAAQRANRLATYRCEGNSLIAQIDGDTPTDPVPTDYRPTADTATLSPQGGLRISLTGALQLAQSLRKADPTPLWTPEMGPGDYQNGTFDGYSFGLQTLQKPHFYPRPLIGHFANAYGFAGGVWWDDAAQTAFCYALNGLPLGDESDAFRPEELAIFAAVAETIDAG